MKKLSMIVCFLISLSLICAAQTPKGNDFQQGKELYSKGEYQEAIPVFKKVIKQNPKKADDAYYYLGMCQLKLENYAASADSFSEALKLRNDNYMQARRGRADAFMKQKNYSAALPDLQQVLASSPEDVDIMYQLVVAQYYLGNYDQAVPYLQKITDAKPQDPQVHYFAGWVYYKLKKYDLTVREFEYYVKLCPDCPDADKIKEILRSLKG
jgi:tetratricopeptide (TPR) repeat protein